eukprot:5596282-Pyramimonas_sp.AAC.1
MLRAKLFTNSKHTLGAPNVSMHILVVSAGRSTSSCQERDRGPSSRCGGATRPDPNSASIEAPRQRQLGWLWAEL